MIPNKFKQHGPLWLVLLCSAEEKYVTGLEPSVINDLENDNVLFWGELPLENNSDIMEV